jgi:HK97 family phage portal protein
MAKQKRNIIYRIFQPWLQKALYNLYPDLLNREHLLSISSEGEDEPTYVPGFRQNAISYTNHMWLQKAVNVLANNIAPLSLAITRGSGQDTEWLTSHPLYALLDTPNTEIGTADLWREWVIDMMLGGEIGFEIVRSTRGAKLFELWPRQPEQFTVRISSSRYRRVSAYHIDDKFGEPYDLLPEEFIHFKFYNPLSPFRGLSPVAAIRTSIVIDQLAQAWSWLFFKNQARPDYAIIAPTGITKTEKKEMENDLEQRFSGSQAHKPIILESGITDIKTFSFLPKDNEWLNQRQMSRDEVAAIVGVPDEIMGYGKDTYENFNAAERVLWTLTIVNLTGLRDNILTAKLRKIGALQPGEKVQTDLRQVPQLQEDKSAKITQAKTLFDMGVPVNQASEYLGMGLKNVEGGDIGYLPSSLWPVDAAARGQMPTPPTPPALPPAGLPAPGAPADNNPAPADNQPADQTPAPGKSVRKATEYASADHEALWKKLQARIDKPVSEMQRLVKREFQRQQNEIGSKLRNGKEFGRGLYKVEAPPPPVDSLFSLEDEIRKFFDAFKQTVTDATGSIGQDTLTELGITGVFDLSRPEVQAAIRGILETVSQKTNQTTWSDLVNLFTEAEKNGEGIPQIQERLSAYFGDRKSDFQTERIARTTMTGASNAGSVDAVRQAQDEYGLQYNKEWVSALTDRTRDAHAEAHGQQVGMNEYFVVGGENLDYPGDPNGSPGNIINCMCNTIFVEAV